jgi:GDSL-like Lipase/Acylhydrolase family
MCDGMRLPIESSFSPKTLPGGRAMVLTAIATLLAAADWLPANPYVDPDCLEFVLTVALGVMAIGISIRERASAADFRRWGARILLSLTMLAICIALAEPVTRVVFRDVTTSADAGGFFSRRWSRTGAVEFNSFGFRERTFTADKPAGVYRIAAVGDSFTFGNGIRAQDRYSDLLQARLPEHFEVLNFGVGGANTPEHRNFVAQLLPGFHPDFVLLQWYVNDVEDDDSAARPTFHPLMPMRELHHWLNDSSALYTVANMKWAEMQVALGMTRSYPEYLQRRLGDPNSPDSQNDRTLLLDLIAMCRRASVPLGIVLFPDTAGTDLGAGYPFTYLHERILDICAAQDLTCLDLRDAFSAVKDHRLLWANRLDHHPSALANEIAAVKIFETYSKQWAALPHGNAAH